MKRLLLIGLAGLSLVGCSNSTGTDEVDYAERAREQNRIREERAEQWKREQQENEIKELLELDGPYVINKEYLLQYVVQNVHSMSEVSELLKNYPSHSSGAYDSTTWNLGDGITVTAKNLPTGFNLEVKSGSNDITSNYRG